MTEPIRTRIAPSPTGDLHIGHLRTILYDYALAKKAGGQFVVRIEDTDRTRFVEGSMERTLDAITDYGLAWDEGPRVEGPYAPYIQSQRLDLYKDYAQQLVGKGLAYYCFLTEAEGEKLQTEARAAGKKFRSPFRDTPIAEAQEMLSQNKPHVIRLKVPADRTIEFEDAILGKVSFETNELDDQVLLKTDGFPTYHLAVVIDDQLMHITHILRGNDWLSSTPKHILLYEAFGWPLPVFAHLPNLKEVDSGKKLSKRFGAVFAIQFLEDGYLPEAMLNFLMMLGWSSPETRTHGEAERELYSLNEFVELFDLDRVHKTALVSFDRNKLVWYNKQYIKNKPSEELQSAFVSWLQKYYEDSTFKAQLAADTKLAAKLELIKDRIDTLKEIPDYLRFFYSRPVAVDWKIKQLEAMYPLLEEVSADIRTLMADLDDDSSAWKHEEWEMGMRAAAEKYKLKAGDVFMVLRVAVTGSPFSPPLFESLQILGKQEILSRILL